MRAAVIWGVVGCLAAGCSTTSNRQPTAATAEPTVVTEPTVTEPTVADSKPVAPAPGQWWAKDDSAVIYISWVVAKDGSIAGFGDYATLSADALNVNSTPINNLTGTMSGDRFTINVLSRTWTGSVQDEDLQLTFVTDSGALRQITLVPGTIDDFNTALADLQATVSANVSVAAQISVEQAQTDQITKLYSQLRSATDTLDAALSTSDLYKALNDAVALVGTDADAARAVAADCSEIGYAVETVEYDVGSVDYEIGSLDSTVSDLATQRDTVRSLANQLSPMADGDDISFAVLTGNTSADNADALIKEIGQHQSAAKASAQSLYNDVDELDDSC